MGGEGAVEGGGDGMANGGDNRGAGDGPGGSGLVSRGEGGRGGIIGGGLAVSSQHPKNLVDSPPVASNESHVQPAPRDPPTLGRQLAATDVRRSSSTQQLHSHTSDGGGGESSDGLGSGGALGE